MQLQRLVPAAALLCLVAVSASPVFDSAEAAEKSRLFKGTAEGVVTEVVTPAHWVIDYVGNATQLGKFTRREQITFGTGGAFSGTITFVAANGDELDADFSGQFISPNDAVGTYTFTGGSGRFSNATGSASFTASTSDFVHVSVAFDGTIDY